MKQSYYSLTIALFLLGANTLAESGIKYKYPDNYIQEYNRECLQTSMEEGLEEIDAKTLCKCTLNKFQQQYSVEEFKEITLLSSTNTESSNALLEVGQSCFEEILYE